jgi:hypothetical protein
MTSAQPPPRPDGEPDDALAVPLDRYSVATGGKLARDEVLGRAVQVRQSDAAGADALEREARFLARLEHAGIPSVHDFVRTRDGALLVMRQVDGIPLAEAIADAKAGTICPELADAVSALHLMQHVCDALAAAHAHGIVHRQLTPAVIVLALHGEVLIGGWSEAAALQPHPLTVRLGAGRAAGAQPEIDDLHVDVRAVGACLFEALVWRPPTAGAADPFADVGAAEGARLSPRLCALIRRALRSDRATGFRGMPELRSAIERCAAEELIAASPESAGRYRRPRRWPTRVAIAAGLVALAAAAFVLPHWQHPADSWRTEIARESFSDDSWRERWSGGDAWVVNGGRLVSSGRDDSRLTLRKRLAVPVAIEYTAQIQAGQRPGDLSVVWSESGADGPGTGQRLVPGARTFSIQAGGYDNSYCGIFQQPGDRRLAHSVLQLETGRDYRFRVEIEGGRFAMYIDGALILEHRDRFPSTSGYISLLGWYPGKSFDNVVVLGRPVLDRVPASAMGDALYGFGHYDDAAALYGRLAEGGDVDGRVAQDAIFRKGMAERRAGRPGDASETWSRLSDPELAQAADTVRLEDLLRTGQTDLFLERLRAYWRRSPQARSELRLQWSAAASATASARIANVPFAEALLAQRRELFANDAITGYEAARVLLRLERYDDVLREFPSERRSCVNALMALGRLDDLDKLSYLVAMDRIGMNFSRGNFTAIAVESGASSYHGAFAICKLGRGADLRDRFNTHPAMLHLGEAAKLLATRPITGGIANEALIALGRIEEAAGAGLPDVPDSGRMWQALAMLGRVEEAEAALGEPMPWLHLIRALEAGDAAAAAAARARIQPPRNLGPGGSWFNGMVLGPFADLLAGKPEGFDASMRTMAKDWRQLFGQRPWRFARAVLGEVGESEVVGMPAVTEGRAYWQLASALRAEREGKLAEARKAYDGYAALPAHLRLLDGNTLSPPIECLVQWRRRALAK